MKKRLLVSLAALLLLCACAKPTETIVTITAPPTSTPAPAPVATPTPDPTPTPTPDLRAALWAAPGQYTIGWLSDTQHYSEEYPQHYLAMTAFLAQYREKLDLRYIVHTGDLVHHDEREAEWLVADEAQRAIDAIPNGVLAGNHDLKNGKPSALYRRYFGSERYADKPWYGGGFDGNRGHYDLVDAGNTRYIFVYMSYGPDSAAIKWMNAVLKEHADRIGVLCVHSYFTTKLALSDQGETLYKKVVAPNPNVYMVLCGHRYNQACIPAAFDDDGDGNAERTVYQMMSNYQAAGQEGGGGYMRFLRFDEAAGTLFINSYSPAAADFVYYDEPGAASEKYAANPANETLALPIPWLAGHA